MFDIGWGELVVIGIVALIAIGPKELPTVLRTLGQYMGKVRRMAAEFQGQFQDALREAEMADLKKHADDIKESVSGLANFDPLADTKKEIESAFDDQSAKSVFPEAAQGSPEPASAAPADGSAGELAAPPAADPPLPDQPTPVTEKDFATVETPTPQQAEGKA
ncbi:MAG TPA: Sec-independent protein translocase protein TatB [Pseudolabrys sp.]|nr:Sec-independent protein translocase protein TatB [Pseudolabrys sp.]